MSDDIAIRVESLSKVYKLYNSPLARIQESLNPFGKQYHQDFYALNDVSFEIRKGDSLGIIGRNGSGKSTLLKILTGVLTPTAGNVIVNGRVSALLELGAGFNPELSGVENVYFNGMLMGYSHEDMDERLDDILSFADIGQFVYQPVKTYSSGMFVRLAFAVGVLVEPDIFIVDEALSVGDVSFQAKCVRKMKDILGKGATLCFVSHDLRAIKSACSTALYLEKGVISSFGEVAKVIEKYDNNNDINKSALLEAKNNVPVVSSQMQTTFDSRVSFERIQNGKANFVNIIIVDDKEEIINNIEYEQTVTLLMFIEVNTDIDLLSCGYKICDKNGIEVIYSGLMIEDKPIKNVKKGDKLLVKWLFSVALMHGDYNMSCILGIPLDPENAVVEICDSIPLALQFTVKERPGVRLFGLVHWSNKVTINSY